MLHPGLYEQVINNQLSTELSEIPEARKSVAPIDKAEASKTLTQYLGNVIEQGLNNIYDTTKGEENKMQAQVGLVNQIISLVKDITQEADFASLEVDQRAEQLFALLQEKDPMLAVGKSAKDLQRPETSLAQSSLFTGSPNEPQMFSELKKEIRSADHIDMLVSFIKWSGLRLIIDDLREFTQSGGQLRVITTPYIGATDIKAVEELRKLSHTTVRVSYDTEHARLHAKSYMFYRDTGFTTAYIGSSNISSSALTSGLEWNVKITKKDQPETIRKIEATFETYWNSSGFEEYTEGQKERLTQALRLERHADGENGDIYTMDIRPYSYQQEILDKLEAERSVRGYYRNLVVAATGTGKTVISALDYKGYCRNHAGEPCRLLFVAHREEILQQSLYTFRAVLKDANFGELAVGAHKPQSIEHLFMSIQTLHSQKFWEKTDPDFYDYIVFDECHHMPASTYQKPLQYYTPHILLGLTATPERMDGETTKILDYFNNRIAAEIRLPEAIDRKLLCPFQYFGVTDTVDLNELRWTAGGYDKAALSNVYTMTGLIAEHRADHVVTSILKYVTDIEDVKGLGFCVSIDHAEFMSRYFNEHGIPSMCLTGHTKDDARKEAKERLVNQNRADHIRFIFVVDIYNEGVDIPEINTVLFLRPTESLTIFLQQMGRGLRLSENKECLTVLDFIGQANKRYNFEDKFAALLSNTTRNVTREIKDGFISVPKGCYIQLEPKAMDIVLGNIKNSINSKKGMVSRISTFKEDTGMECNFTNFINYYHINPRSIYHKGYTFAELCAAADIQQMKETELTPRASKILHRLSIVDSPKWLDFIRSQLPNVKEKQWSSYSIDEQLMWKMLYVSIWDKPIENFGFTSILEGIIRFRDDNQLYEEFLALIDYCREHINVVGKPPQLPYKCPLEIHCTYTRAQALAGLDFLENYSVSEGVKYLKNTDTDVFFVTLNKADRYYSPTTAYHDYSICESLFHWQSQSTTSEISTTGRRYMGKSEHSGPALLFVRESKSDVDGPTPFAFLGRVFYSTHQGSRPMNITWKLNQPIPAKFLKKTNKLVVG